jgi:predicted  nucleic acid-binding Zn-ribbon protein
MKNLITFENLNPNLKNLTRAISEKWDSNVKVEKTGEHADKTIAQLKKELKSLKEKSKVYQEEGKKVPKRIIEQEAEIKFAIRAKQGWKKKIS